MNATRIARQRLQKDEQMATVMKLTGITQDEYNMVFVESACRFMDELYPIGSTFEKYRKIYFADPNFWAWFTTEWNAFENGFLLMVRTTDIKPTHEFWSSQMMNTIAHDASFENNFHKNYIKILSHKHVKV